MKTIGINNFVKRQTQESEFTHFNGSWESLIELVKENFDKAKPGYREGVCLVPVPAEGFFCGIMKLQEGDKLVGEYKARRPGEEPRKTLRAAKSKWNESQIDHAHSALDYHAKGKYYGPIENIDQYRKILDDAKAKQKSPCKAVDIVLYSREVLQKGNENCTGCDWDIISINGRLTEDEMPIHPNTLIANHFQLDGGTATNMSSEEFEKALKKSVLFWKDKAMLEA